MLRCKNLQEFSAFKGTSLPNSKWIKVTQQMITDFANATFDKQWIHIDEKRAQQESPYGCTIAHGFMSVSLLSKFLEDVVQIDSLKMGINYGLNTVRFISPVLVNSQLQLQSRIHDIEISKQGMKVTFACEVLIKGQDKPACVAEFIALFIE